jgi:hypothetical protein
MAHMMGRSRCLAVLIPTLLAGTAAADPAPRPPSEADRKLASELVKKAIARSQDGDHQAAIEIYMQANTLAPNSLLLSNIGSEFQQEGMLKEALDHFCKYLEKDPSGTNAPYALAQAKILRRQLGKKKVDDRDVCVPDEEDDRPRRKIKRDVPPEETATESVEPRGPKDGRVKDGKDGKDRKDGRDSSGKDGRDSRDSKDGRDGSGKDGGAVRVPERNNGNPTLMYAGIGAGIVGLAAAGVGVYYGFQARDVSDQINGHDMTKPWPDNIKDLQARGQHYENLQIGYLIAGGVLATAGAVLYVVSRPDGSERSDKATISVAPTTNGISVFGRF